MSLRKDALIVLLITILCMLLFMQWFPPEPPETGAGGLAAEPPDAAAAAKEDEPRPDIRLAMDVHLPEEAFRRLNERLEQMNRSFPHVRVEAANFPREGAVERLDEAAAAGELADIVMLDLEWAARFAAKGHLARWPGHEHPASDPVQQLTGWNGYRWIAPWETDPYVVAYSGSLEAFAPGESLPRTLGEWAELADRLKAGSGVGGLIYADPDDPGAFITLISAMGGSWRRTESGMIAPGDNGREILALLFGVGPEGGGERAPLAVTEKLAREDMWRRFADGTLPIIIVPLSELAGRGMAHRQVAGLVAAEDAGARAYWIKGTGLAVSSSSGFAGEAFEWLETLLFGRDPGTAGRWPEHMAVAFGGDPDLPDKLEALKAALPSLYAGGTGADAFLESLEAQRPAP